ERLSTPSGGIRYHCDVRQENSSSSGAPSSSDSGVAHLLERAHAAFSIAPHPTPMYTSAETTRQKGPPSSPLEGERSLSWPMEVSRGGGDGNVTQVSTMVREYVAGLVSGKNAEEWEERREYTTVDNGSASPDSDSSLSRAITKSLGLSTSLGRQCGLELDQLGGVNIVGDHQERPSHGSAVKARHSSSDSDTESSRILATKHAIDEADFEKKRKLLIQELVEAERCYCSTLRTLKQVFAEPLSAKDILSPKDVDTLFPREVEELHQQHSLLLTMLEESVCKMGHPDQKSLGDILRHFIEPEGLDALRLYTSYVDNFPDALQTFHKLCRCSPEFTNFLKDCLDSPDCGGLDLGGFLLTPVQRLPRLVLVLRRLLALTPQHHSDWAPISFAISRLATFLTRLNDSMEHSFQLVAAQIGSPSEREEADFGNLENFDESVCGESTVNDDEELHELTSDGEVGLEMKSVSNLAQAMPPANKDPETCSTGIRRKVGQIMASTDKLRPVSGLSCAGETSILSRTNTPAASSIHMDQDSLAEEARQTHICLRDETPTKKVGCHCIRRGRDVRVMKKYSRLCSMKSREGNSSPDLSNVDSRDTCSGSVRVVLRKEQNEERWRCSGQSNRVEDYSCRMHRHTQCCMHDYPGCGVVQRRRGASLPRRAYVTDMRRRTHSAGRTSGERETSSDDELEISNVRYISSAQHCKVQEMQNVKEKTKRKWFKTSKSLHDVPNHAVDAYKSDPRVEVEEEVEGVRRRHHSGNASSLSSKLTIARSVDNLSVDGSVTGDEVPHSRGVSAEGREKLNKTETETHRQLLYTARMLRCSSLEVATLEKLSETKDSNKTSQEKVEVSKEEEGGKKGKNKKLSLRASIKNMLSFKRREENQPSNAVAPKCTCQLSLPKNAGEDNVNF
ncbi:hypothetical protein J437_LFUL006837, partial [Ladona fulva]